MIHWRFYFLVFVILIVASGVTARLFTLQILQYDNFKALAEGQHQFYQTLFPDRGEIYMQDLSEKKRTGQLKLQPLAINKEFTQAFLIPQDANPATLEQDATALADALELDKQTILNKMSKADDPYEPLAHKLNQEMADKLAQMEIDGLGLMPETWRYYPNNDLACHLLGFVGQRGDERMGQYGLEGYYEDALKGEPGHFAGQKDTAGYGIASFSQSIEPAKDGADLILTIDQNIQYKAERVLKEAAERLQAEQGTIIIMAPQTGAIMAMANWPEYNPNEYNKVEDINVFLNPAIQNVYESGSVFKPITMSIGLETDKVNPGTTYTDTGEVWIRNSVIRNVDGKSYGLQTMTQVLEKSLNTGAIFVQQAVGEKLFSEYVASYNFNMPTGVDLVGEVGGDISNLFTGRDINLATISFGQGITVTSLGLLTAISTIANEGKMMQPYLVDRIVYENGEPKITEPKEIKRVISAETAKELTRMLVSAVEIGYGKKARVSGYDIAGKTGTAQIADLELGGYKEDEFVHSFIGYAPAFNPEFAILIKVDKPKGLRFASDSIAPTFKELAEYLFNYLEISP